MSISLGADAPTSRGKLTPALHDHVSSAGADFPRAVGGSAPKEMGTVGVSLPEELVPSSSFTVFPLTSNTGLLG